MEVKSVEKEGVQLNAKYEEREEWQLNQPRACDKHSRTQLQIPASMQNAGKFGTGYWPLHEAVDVQGVKLARIGGLGPRFSEISCLNKLGRK